MKKVTYSGYYKRMREDHIFFKYIYDRECLFNSAKSKIVQAIKNTDKEIIYELSNKEAEYIVSIINNKNMYEPLEYFSTLEYLFFTDYVGFVSAIEKITPIEEKMLYISYFVRETISLVEDKISPQIIAFKIKGEKNEY